MVIWIRQDNSEAGFRGDAQADLILSQCLASAWRESRFALLSTIRHTPLPPRRLGPDVAVLHLSAAGIPRWSGFTSARIHFSSGYYHRVCMGAQQWHAHVGNQSFVAASRGHF